MSKLNFSNIDEAFVLGSKQIKDTQEEISNLKKMIMEDEVKSASVKASNLSNANANVYQRIGPPDNVQANFGEAEKSNHFDLENNFFKMIQHPRFDDLVYNYVKNNHPKWVLSDKQYVKSDFKSNFGGYSTTVCSDIKNYLTFFTISIVIYLLLSLLVKKE